MNEAFDKQALDFNFFEQALTGKVKQLREKAKKYADSVKKGEYQHTGVQIDFAMNAPLFLIPENIFEYKNYIKLDTGFITAKSYLIPYD